VFRRSAASILYANGVTADGVQFDLFLLALKSTRLAECCSNLFPPSNLGKWAPRTKCPSSFGLRRTLMMKTFMNNSQSSRPIIIFLKALLSTLKDTFEPLKSEIAA